MKQSKPQLTKRMSARDKRIAATARGDWEYLKNELRSYRDSGTCVYVLCQYVSDAPGFIELVKWAMFDEHILRPTNPNVYWLLRSAFLNGSLLFAQYLLKNYTHIYGKESCIDTFISILDEFRGHANYCLLADYDTLFFKYCLRHVDGKSLSSDEKERIRKYGAYVCACKNTRQIVISLLGILKYNRSPLFGAENKDPVKLIAQTIWNSRYQSMDM